MTTRLTRLQRRELREKQLRKVRGALALSALIASFLFLYQPHHITLPKFELRTKANAQSTRLVTPIPLDDYLQALRPTATPMPTATPVPTIDPQLDAYSYDVAGAIRRIWGKDASVGLAISSCESGIDANKYHINDDGSIDFGPMQINTVHGVFLDPEANIREGYKLYLEQGLTPWYSSQPCWQSKI